MTVKLRDLYPAAQQISFVIVTVPDPRVPRYRRLYDLSIEALQLGMLSQSYTLDRWSTPWRGANLSSADKKHVAGADNYGLMVFRCDTWRDGPSSSGHACSDLLTSKARKVESQFTPEARLRVVYLVPETATQGLGWNGLGAAIARIEAQLPAGNRDADGEFDGDHQVGLLSFPTLSYPKESCARGGQGGGGSVR